MIRLDGSMGEGGGQILRSALALSLATGAPFQIENVRARRKPAGLMRQHVACVRAAVEISGSSVEGAELGSSALTFRPRAARAGAYRFAVGTAGSTTLILQTVLMPLLLAGAASSLRFEGGTHNPGAPPFDFVDRVFLESLRRLGANVSARLERHGFYPAGGGAFVVELESSGRLAPLESLHRSQPVLSARILLANLPAAIAAREAAAIVAALELPRRDIVIEHVDSDGPGNAVLLEANAESHREISTGFGERSVRAEQVAATACAHMKAYLASDAPIGCQLADQLLVPLALGDGGVFRTLAPSSHFETNTRVVAAFLGDVVHVEAETTGASRVVVDAASRS
jgi:RNA 3'-terminal phosphate cyclase (ATP)